MSHKHHRQRSVTSFDYLTSDTQHSYSLLRNIQFNYTDINKDWFAERLRYPLGKQKYISEWCMQYSNNFENASRATHIVQRKISVADVHGDLLSDISSAEFARTSKLHMVLSGFNICLNSSAVSSSANEVTLKYMGKNNKYQTIATHSTKQTWCRSGDEQLSEPIVT